MTAFLALYVGKTVCEAQLVALSADVQLVADVAERLVREDNQADEPISSELASGRRAALRLIAGEKSGATNGGDAPDDSQRTSS